MSWDKLESMAFKHDDASILEKIEIFDSVINTLQRGEEFVELD